MKLVEVKKYKGFETKFFILPKTEKFLIEQKINIKEFLPDEFHWYEHIIFDLLDSKLEKKNIHKKKKFKVVFYGIIKKYINKKTEGFIEKIPFDKTKVLQDTYLTIHKKDKKPFAIREKIIIE